MSTKPAYCPVCRQKKINLWSLAKDYEYFSTDDEYAYYECQDCQSIFIHPVPTEQLAQIYPPNYYSFVSKSGNIVVRTKEWLDRIYFKKNLRKIQSSEIHLLDIGGGTGWMIDNLKKTDTRIRYSQIVDIDAKAKKVAEHNGHFYFEGAIEKFSTDKKFNLILMLNLVEHVENPLAIVQKAEALLEPGGFIIIKTPNTNSWDAHLFRKKYWGGLHCPRHWVIFSEKSFRILLQSTSLRIRELNYTQGAPFWAFSIIAGLHKKKIVNISSSKPLIFHWLFAPVSAFFALIDFIRKPFAKTSQMFIVLEKEQNTA